MSERPPEPGGDAGEPSERNSAPGVPRWVTVFGVVALVLVLLVVVVLLAGEGHGPRRHVPPAGAEHSVQPSAAASFGEPLR